MRVLTADTHPDHDTLCSFRRENKALHSESFVKVLQLAQQLKVLQVGQLTVAADGSKVLANASKHSAVSYQRAGEMIRARTAGGGIEVMRHRLRTTAGKALYKLRQQTVEPVFGIIKSVLGFRPFHLRGREKVSLEWTLVCLAYNFKRLHRLQVAA